MALRYQTEYHFGRRGRICRTYSGIQALLAIVFDMMLGLVFGVIELALRITLLLVTTSLRLVIALVSLPLKVARALSDHLAARPVLKPVRAGFEEL